MNQHFLLAVKATTKKQKIHIWTENSGVESYDEEESGWDKLETSEGKTYSLKKFLKNSCDWGQANDLDMV